MTFATSLWMNKTKVKIGSQVVNLGAFMLCFTTAKPKIKRCFASF